MSGRNLVDNISLIYKQSILLSYWLPEKMKFCLSFQILVLFGTTIRFLALRYFIFLIDLYYILMITLLSPILFLSFKNIYRICDFNVIVKR